MTHLQVSKCFIMKEYNHFTLDMFRMLYIRNTRLLSILQRIDYSHKMHMIITYCKLLNLFLLIKAVQYFKWSHLEGLHFKYHNIIHIEILEAYFRHFSSWILEILECYTF